MGSMCTCIGPPDTIVQGNPTVLINGKPIACVGDMTAHGGIIVSGEANIIVGSATPEPPKVTMPIKKIPFPKITLVNRILGNAKEAIANQEEIRRQSESTKGEKRIYGLKWIKEERVVKKSKVLKRVTLRASTVNFEEGESVTLTLSRHKKEMSEEGIEEIVGTLVEELTGTVQDKMVEVVWEIEEGTNQQS